MPDWRLGLCEYRFKTEHTSKKVRRDDKNEISSVSEGEKGVEVVLSGNVTVKQTLQMVQDCSTGSCSCCTPTFMEQITKIDVAGQDGEVRIQIEGDVKPEEIKRNLGSCDKEV